jgi:hypothetical protein
MSYILKSIPSKGFPQGSGANTFVPCTIIVGTDTGDPKNVLTYPKGLDLVVGDFTSGSDLDSKLTAAAIAWINANLNN